MYDFQEQVTFSLVYTCFLMYKTNEFPKLDLQTQKMLLHGTILGLEMSRFRTMVEKDELYTGEHDWLLFLETSLLEFFVNEPPHLVAKQVC